MSVGTVLCFVVSSSGPFVLVGVSLLGGGDLSRMSRTSTAVGLT